MVLNCIMTGETGQAERRIGVVIEEACWGRFLNDDENLLSLSLQ